jgi:DNA-binding MarR family transcriptional regulator
VKLQLDQFDKAFQNKIRLQVMSVLVTNDGYDFLDLKELLDLSDGNLASHMKALEKEEYVRVEKTFKGRKPLTTYFATGIGRKAFEKHLAALEQLIKEQKNN